MTKPHVAIITANRRMKRYATRALASADLGVHHATFDDRQVEAQLQAGRDLYLVDADEDPALICSFFERLSALDGTRHEASALLLSQDMENRLIIDLLSERGLNNFIARHTGVSAHQDMIDEAELIVTCQKLLSRDIYGLEKYMPTWGMKIHHHRVASVDDKFRAMNALEEFLNRIDCFAGVIPAIALVGEELLMNAVFNAPRTADGRAKYSHRDRAEVLQLAPHEEVSFHFGCDGRYVGLAVSDSFGSLARADIVRYLEQCFIGERGRIEDKQGGAGLGLYMVFNSMTQLTFNITVGKRTEVVALFYIRSGARAFRRSGRSLNIFMFDG